jgi:hypothetical protein
VSTLEAINIVLGGGHMIVVVGMDKALVEEAIQKEQKYEDAGKASQFLAKIVQVGLLRSQWNVSAVSIHVLQAA